MFQRYLRLIYPADCFCKTPTLNFKRSSHFSFCGSVLSLLMFAALAIYFIWQMVLMATIPVTGSETQYGKLSETLDLSKIQVCSNLNSSSPYYSEWIDNVVFFRSNTSYFLGEAIMDFEICHNDDACLCFKDNVAIEAIGDGITGLVIGAVKIADFVNSSDIRSDMPVYHKNNELDQPEIQFSVKLPIYKYTPNNIDGPMEEDQQYISISVGQGSDSEYHFEKVVYNIMHGFLWPSKKEYQTMTLNYVENTPASLEGGSFISLLFDGRVTTNTRNFRKITEILSAVVGLKGAIVLVITAFFGQYFNFKYFESLINNVTRFEKAQEKKKLADSDPENPQPMQRDSEKDNKVENFYSEIRITYFGYVCNGIRKILRKMKKEKYSDDEKMHETLNRKRMEIEDQLDVIHILHRLKEFDAMQSKVNRLTEKVSKLEMELEKKTAC